MIIYNPSTPLEAVTIRKEHEDTVYLAGGTDNLRLGSSAIQKDFIDINNLVSRTIEIKSNKVVIGAGVTLQQLSESDLVPSFIREAALFCSSYVRRCSATVGGNLALRRGDSYLASAFTVANAVVHRVTPHGEDEKFVGEYLTSDCKCFIQSISFDKNCTGWVKRIGNTSASHATLICAGSDGRYALSVFNTPFVYGDSKSIVDNVDFVDDMTGSAAYKKYLANTIFAERR